MAYCKRDDVYQLGIPASAFVALARPSAADAATATIRLKGHGLTTQDQISFEVTSGGSLPTGISAFVVYYPIPVSSDLFRLSLTQGGTPIASWVSAGTGWSILIDQGRRLDANIDDACARIDECLTAHELPLLPDAITGKYPIVLIGVSARMAARQAVATLTVEGSTYRQAIDRLVAQEKADDLMLADWKKGKPIQPRPTDSDTIADNAPLAFSSTPQPWRTGSL